MNSLCWALYQECIPMSNASPLPQLQGSSRDYLFPGGSISSGLSWTDPTALLLPNAQRQPGKVSAAFLVVRVSAQCCTFLEENLFLWLLKTILKGSYWSWKSLFLQMLIKRISHLILNRYHFETCAEKEVNAVPWSWKSLIYIYIL